MYHTLFVHMICTFLWQYNGAPSNFLHLSYYIITHKLASAQSMYVKANAAVKASDEVMEKAKKSMETSTKYVESMHELSTKAKKELEDAQKFLAEVEKRHEVIEITDDDDTVPSSEEGAGGKKRKVSLSPQISSSVGARDTTSNNNIINNSTLRVVEQLVVEGCGASIINGTYKRSGLYNNGFPVYEKEAVQWGGIQTKFLIHSPSHSGSFGCQVWSISTIVGTSICNFYTTFQTAVTAAPMDNMYWMALPPYGISPLPLVKQG